MNKNIIKLEIDNQNFIQIILPCRVEEVTDCDEVSVELHNQGKVYIALKEDVVGVVLEHLDNTMTRILGTNPSPQESDPDWGRLWNEYHYKMMTRKQNEALPDWNFPYPMWSLMSTGVSNWLAIRNGLYFFEITPDFEWNLDNEETPAEEIEAFRKFMAAYKLIATVKVPKERLIEWKKQCEEALHFIHLTMQKIFPPN